MELNVANLYFLAKRVAKSHNGKQYTRWEQISAIQALQAFILETENQALASSESSTALLTPQPSVPLPGE